MADSGSTLLILPYGSDGSKQSRVRRGICMSCAAMLLVIFFAPARKYSDLACSQVREAKRYAASVLERRSAEPDCLDYTAPAGTIAFDEAPIRSAESLLYSDRYFGSCVRWPTTDATSEELSTWRWETGALFQQLDERWTRFEDAEMATNSSGIKCVMGFRPQPMYRTIKEAPLPLVFLHSRRAHDGPERLVCIQFDSTGFEWRSAPGLVVSVFATGGWGQSRIRWQERVKDVSLLRESPLLKVYFGQPDATDQSHLTIPYEIGASHELSTAGCSVTIR